MTIKSDKWIRRMAAEHRMIEPFEPGQVRTANGHKIVSYGTSSYGYDIRCSDEFKIFTNINSTIVDPKNFDEKSFVDFKGDVCIIPPNSFALARTVEYFRIPRNVLTVCLGKSTYARCGIIVNVTPFEPEWEGYVTLEFSNTTPLPAKIYANEGVAQVVEEALLHDPLRRQPLGEPRQRCGPGHGAHTPRRGPAVGATSARNGLVARSRPIVVVGPCPGSTTVSSASGSTLVRSERSIAWWSPPGRSVRPMEPANSTSPDTHSGGSSPAAASRNITEPSVCPGAWSTAKDRPARSIVRPSLNLLIISALLRAAITDRPVTAIL